MNSPEWHLPSTRDWVVRKLWEEHKRSPGGIGLFLKPENLQPGDPPFKLVCEAVEYLLGEEWVTAEFGHAMGQKGPIFVSKLRLTPQAIANIQDQLEREPTRPIGFCTKD